MRIWLIKVQEELPTDPGPPRLARTGLLAATLSARSHDVTWWTSRFDFRRKRHRDEPVAGLGDHGYRIRLLESRGFRKHRSLERVLDNRDLNRSFQSALQQEVAPDLILTAYPTIELSRTAVRYARRSRIPVVVDVRDLWPDIFLRALPRGARWLGPLVFVRSTRAARETLADATALCGITEPIVNWAVNVANRPRREADRAFPHGYRRPVLTATERAEGDAFWERHGIKGRAEEFVVAYLGQLTATLEFDTVVEAARLLSRDSRPIRFVFAGAGGHEPTFRRQAAGLTNVSFVGWIDQNRIWTLLERASLGLLCYHSSFDYELSIPNKPIEYMAAGLPVLSSLRQGVLHDLLMDHQCGLSYRNGNPAQLASLIVESCDHPEWRRRMGRAAARLFDGQFDADRVYGDMAAYLERLGNGKSRLQPEGGG